MKYYIFKWDGIKKKIPLKESKEFSTFNEALEYFDEEIKYIYDGRLLLVAEFNTVDKMIVLNYDSKNPKQSYICKDYIIIRKYGFRFLHKFNNNHSAFTEWDSIIKMNEGRGFVMEKVTSKGVKQYSNTPKKRGGRPQRFLNPLKLIEDVISIKDAVGV